jgi:epoxyqueuosine reductase
VGYFQFHILTSVCQIECAQFDACETTETMPTDLKALITLEALAAGFTTARVTQPDANPAAAARFDTFLEAGRHGEMEWLSKHADRRRSPGVLWPEAKSVIMLGKSYAPAENPIATAVASDRGVISAYARGKDYHDLVKSGLKRVARALVQASGAEVKVFVDTAPLMEKPLAQAAGIGWQGKHTNLVSRTDGSWLFLGAILTTAVIAPDAAETDHCGSCTRCLDACPTRAFPAPYQLDARRCIAYLTIEHPGHIDDGFRRAIGNRVFGCDDCLAVCPWNRFAATASDIRLHARVETDNPPLAALLVLDDAAFRARFAGTPIKRTGRDRVVRNALIAAGNSGDASLLVHIKPLLTDASPLVRAMAVWALLALADDDEIARLATRHQPHETDSDVRAEWTKPPRTQQP